MKDVQCYKLFGGIAPKNHAFSFFSFHISVCSKTVFNFTNTDFEVLMEQFANYLGMHY